MTLSAAGAFADDGVTLNPRRPMIRTLSALIGLAATAAPGLAQCHTVARTYAAPVQYAAPTYQYQAAYAAPAYQAPYVAPTYVPVPYALFVVPGAPTATVNVYPAQSVLVQQAPPVVIQQAAPVIVQQAAPQVQQAPPAGAQAAPKPN
jgi:hypothetical protein